MLLEGREGQFEGSIGTQHDVVHIEQMLCPQRMKAVLSQGWLCWCWSTYHVAASCVGVSLTIHHVCPGLQWVLVPWSISFIQWFIWAGSARGHESATQEDLSLLQARIARLPATIIPPNCISAGFSISQEFHSRQRSEVTTQTRSLTHGGLKIRNSLLICSKCA